MKAFSESRRMKISSYMKGQINVLVHHRLNNNDDEDGDSDDVDDMIITILMLQSYDSISASILKVIITNFYSNH